MLVEEEEVLVDDDFPSRPGPSRPRQQPRLPERYRGGSSSRRRTSTSSQSLMDESVEEASHDYNRSTSTEGSRRRSARLSRAGTTDELDSLASISTGASASGRPRRAAAIAAVASMRSNG